MKIMLNSMAIIIFLIASNLTMAQSNVSHHSLTSAKVVTLSVPGMTCATCPITVKKALEELPGVIQVISYFKNKTMVVHYQPNKISTKNLLDATKNVGYPSSISKKEPKG